MRRRRRRRFGATLVVFVGLVVAASVLLRPPATPPANAVVVTPPTSAASGTALAAAQQLEVKGRAPKTGYARDLYGEAWQDVDGNGCDTRNDMLRRDLVDTQTSGCIVSSGTLHDPYTGRDIAFQRGEDTSPLVQIDHVVALSDSWQKGAQSWDAARRTAFANDPLNLLAVDGPTNEQKGDGDTATWLPPDTAYRCAYVARQVAVKAAYALWVTSAEQTAMVGVLTTCPDEPLPVAVPAPAVAPGSFEGCAQAWADGQAPIYAGDPRYDPGSDGDGDGIACEHRP